MHNPSTEANQSPPMSLPTRLALAAALDPDAARRHIDAAILATIDAGVRKRGDNRAQRQDHQAKAGLFRDVAHFMQLCERNLRDGYEHDRLHGERITRNRVQTWRTQFRYFAEHAGITQDIHIASNGRKGLYSCTLIDKVNRDLAEFLRYGKRLGYGEEELSEMVRAKQAQHDDAPVQASEPEASENASAQGGAELQTGEAARIEAVAEAIVEPQPEAPAQIVIGTEQAARHAYAHAPSATGEANAAPAARLIGEEGKGRADRISSAGNGAVYSQHNGEKSQWTNKPPRSDGMQAGVTCTGKNNAGLPLNQQNTKTPIGEQSEAAGVRRILDSQEGERRTMPCQVSAMT